MYVKDSDARERLLEAGKQEFLAYGFQNASLRRICSRVGMTTGALYSCFRNKEDLFASIVGDTMEELLHLMRKSCEAECADPSLSADSDVDMMRFLWPRRDIVMLLLEKADGTRFADARNRIEKLNAELLAVFFRRHTGQELDPQLLSILVSMRVNSYIDILKSSNSQEQAEALAETLSAYTNAGFQKLMVLAVSPEH